MAFLKTLLIILLVYFGLKFLFKLVAPYLMRYLAKKTAQKFENAFGQSPFGQQQSDPEGSVTIDGAPSTKSKSKSTVGEYVDYEEID